MAQTEPLAWRMLGELVNAFEGIDGDPYWYDLTGPGQVRVGTYQISSPPRDGTCVAVGQDSTEVTWGEGTLTGVSPTYAYVIQGWAMATADSAEERLHAAQKLEQDLLQALRVAVNTRPSLLASSYEIRASSSAHDGQQVGLKKSCGYVAILLTCSAHLEATETT